METPKIVEQNGKLLDFGVLVGVFFSRLVNHGIDDLEGVVREN